MKRLLVSTAWVLGSTVPLALAAIFLFGCCVLPFHKTLHELIPLCNIAAAFTAGHHQGSGQPATPAEKREQVTKKHVPVESINAFTLPAAARENSRVAMSAGAGHYRSFISLGAVRCDDDVGLRLSLLDTFRI